jgi:hypothetical protein
MSSLFAMTFEDLNASDFSQEKYDKRGTSERVYYGAITELGSGHVSVQYVV